MSRLFTLPQFTSLRRKLRKRPTKAESFLWFHLQNRKFLNYKFRRQHSMGRYVLDFFCPQLMLCIEVDGITHLYQSVQRKDKIRQQWIEDHGVRVIRFTDPEVLGDIDDVLERLRGVILSTPHPSSSRRETIK